MDEANEPLPNGTVINGRYLIVDLLGKGGFSAVYFAKDLQGTDSFFALKEVIISDKMSSEHITFEYSLLERLSHPALPRVHQVFENEEHNRLYMLMDYVEGPNLETLRQIQHEQRFSLPVITSILAPVVDAIAYLHQQNPAIVHRDIKPSNIIVPIVERKTVLVDFGIAKEYDTQGTTSAVRYGSHGYGAPEQYSSGTNTRTDIYGLGATLYTLLTGEVPADALDRMTQLSNDYSDPLKPPSELVPSIPLHVSRAIQRAMSINMMQRFATAQEFWQALHGESAQQPLITEATTPKTVSPSAYWVPGKTGETPTHPPQVKQAPARRSKKSLLLLAILVLLLIVGTGASYWGYTLFKQVQVATPTSDPPTAVTPTPIARPTVTTTIHSKPDSYPKLDTSYYGQITDLVANEPSQMTLTGVSQKDGQISGTFNALNMHETFNGFFVTSKQISFFVATRDNHGQLTFTGSIKPDGELTGQFWTIAQNSNSINNDDYGVWTVVPKKGNPVTNAFSTTNNLFW
jgi:eukaryotic-like serine/threonine-protein kinase